MSFQRLEAHVNCVCVFGSLFDHGAFWSLGKPREQNLLLVEGEDERTVETRTELIRWELSRVRYQYMYEGFFYSSFLKANLMKPGYLESKSDESQVPRIPSQNPSASMFAFTDMKYSFFRKM